MRETAIFPFSLAAIAVFCCLGAQTGKPAWKGKIVVEDGVKVVKNPRQSLYGEFAFDLQEGLTIGGDPKNEVYYFSKGGSLSIDEEGSLYFTDLGNKRV